MTEKRLTTRRWGKNARDVPARIAPDEPDLIDRWYNSVEFCPLARFDQLMQAQYPDWQQFVTWVTQRNEANNG